MFINSMLGYNCYLLCEDFLIDCSMSLVENNRNVCLSYELYFFSSNVLWIMVKELFRIGSCMTIKIVKWRFDFFSLSI
ncbi:hypothetical protein HanHA300_Chr08g0294791 [Helianthus annuus]|nr:hypothetical protein HanHA300_Chr08g0294791 [Helianthus annuus]KAJ0554880.1 hypothetical protein HanHA89_Chr08g0313311 [Helianthus annuus]KAJ0720443.1 hypothetical protein HanLR1_Chr08g0293611 [Helianthus annuus]KAJ0723647.1 hypothetical protein HanOQP8_Chr08g0300841 [Helianthus annuus]KAJ0808009.1 hypothetical protein HanLR1_Chr00c0852g0777271 [Helianthus annuus]